MQKNEREFSNLLHNQIMLNPFGWPQNGDTDSDDN